MINAMVSHELRNPINSIQNQNLLQRALNEKINELIDDERIKSVKALKKKLRRLLSQFYETNDVRMKSTKILNYLVNDILDFAQMRSGKFRKQNQCCDLAETIHEIFNIQEYKAEQMGINMTSEFENFSALAAR